MSSREVHTAATVATGTPRPGWCPACKANSAFTTSVCALFPTGVTSLGTVTVCEICDDPDDPEANRA
ncbi:hypothetical protein ACIQZB_00275 [Streptomyces sp. NPDC097727]|uniref:hypothetical protein n=1 Tax=Streptomyces sp. NPDC097727 TaxID=3366092 RepID=UPI00382B84DF